MADPRITFRIGVDDAASEALKRLGGQVDSLKSSFKSLAGFGGIGIVTAAITSLGKSAFDLADELQNASERLGISASTLQKIKVAADASGASVDGLQKSMVFLARQIDKALSGNKDAAESFRRIGIAAKDLSGVSLDRRLALIGQQLALIEDPGTRAALAVDLLGKSAVDNIPALLGLQEQLDQINTTLSDDEIKALDEAGDAWKRWENAAITATGKALIWLEKVGEWWGKFNAGEVGPFAKKGGVGRPGGGISQRTQQEDVRKAFADQFAPTNQEVTKSAKTAADKTAAEMQKLFDATRTPLEEYGLTVAHITELHEKFGLSADVASRAIQQAGAKLGEATQAQVDASAAGKQWNKDLEDTARILQGLKTPFDDLADAYLRIDELVAKGNLTSDQGIKAKAKALEEMLGPVKQEAQQVGSSINDIFKEIADNTSGLARDITNVFFDATDGIGKMFENLLDRIARAIVEKGVIQPLIDIASGALSGIFGGGPQFVTVPSSIQKRAFGGTVSAGMPYIVGERGQELFVPRQSGTIIPNGAMASAPAVNITVTSLDPRSAAAVIAANEHVIVGAMRRAYTRAGRTAPV